MFAILHTNHYKHYYLRGKITKFSEREWLAKQGFTLQVAHCVQVVMEKRSKQ